MDLFKKVGVEAIPFMTELNENLRVAHEQGFGPTEEDIRRFAEYQREVTVLETKWDALVRKFKEGLVVTVTSSAAPASCIRPTPPPRCRASRRCWRIRSGRASRAGRTSTTRRRRP
jgi:hypothetical protein